MTWLQTFAVLCACRALADYPLQGDWLSKAKNRRLNLVPPPKPFCDSKETNGTLGPPPSSGQER